MKTKRIKTDRRKERVDSDTENTNHFSKLMKYVQMK